LRQEYRRASSAARQPSARGCDHGNGLNHVPFVDGIRERPDIVRNKDGANRSRKHRLCCRCPTTRRPDQEDVGARCLSDPDDLGSWHSSLDRYLDVTPALGFRRDRHEQSVVNLRRRWLGIHHDARACDQCSRLTSQRHRLSDNADRGRREIDSTDNAFEQARSPRIEPSNSPNAARSWTLATSPSGTGCGEVAICSSCPPRTFDLLILVNPCGSGKRTSIPVRSDHLSRSTTYKRELLILRLPLLL
jgi:hypothetical protein